MLLFIVLTSLEVILLIALAATLFAFVLFCLTYRKKMFHLNVTLRSRQAQLQIALRGIEQKNESLRTALALSTEASEAKSRFTSRVSHEMRTPLNAIKGYLSMSIDSLDDKDKLKHCLEQATCASEQLMRMVNDVLDLSSVENRQLSLSCEPFDMKELLSNVISVFLPQAREKGVELKIRLENVIPDTLWGDGQRLNQILSCLLSNALKYTKSGGKVLLRVKSVLQNESQLYVEFVVSDTGVGMKEDFLRKLFTPYEQEQRESEIQNGAGLSLCVTNSLIRLMNGTIKAESVPQTGSTFTLVIPFKAELARNDVKQRFSKLSALVVCDEMVAREQLQRIIKECGIEYCRSCNGNQFDENPKQRFDVYLIEGSLAVQADCKRLTEIELRDANSTVIVFASDITDTRQKIGDNSITVLQRPLSKQSICEVLTNSFTVEEETAESKKEQKRVLLVEDNEMNREIALELLKALDYVSEYAVNGQQAVKMFAESANGYYSAVLMDVQMPVKDGYAATELIRSLKRKDAKSVPIIAMTADAFAADISKALSSGMNSHLAKPVDLSLLKTTLERLIK